MMLMKHSLVAGSKNQLIIDNKRDLILYQVSFVITIFLSQKLSSGSAFLQAQIDRFNLDNGMFGCFSILYQAAVKMLLANTSLLTPDRNMLFSALR